MTRVISALLIITVLLSFTLGACVPKEKETPTKPLGEAIKPPSQATKQAGEDEWQRIVEEAKKEKVVTVYTNWLATARVETGKAFKERFGIDVEFTAAGKGPELVAKLETERRAGLFQADVIGSGSSTFLTEMNPKGMLAPLEPMIILPEAKDTKVRVGGKLFLDKEKKVIPLGAEFYSGLTHNTELVKEEELKSYYDVLDPKWKGKIAFNDPTVPGQGHAQVSHLVRLWGLDKAKNFLQQLVKQEPVINRDLRLQVEWMAKGKYPLGIGLHTVTTLEFKKLGAPVAITRLMKEPGVLTPGASCLGLPAGQLPHPNAAKVFINWLLTKEGQTIFSKAMFQPSSRTDVSTEGFEDLIPLPGQTFIEQYDDDGVALLMTNKVVEICQDILAPLMK